ncbi:MAG: hypothetical protein R2717_09835 [Schumannella sp.]
MAEYEDPFGMIGSVRAVGEADRLVVVPDVVELPAGGPALADGEGTAILVQRRVVGNDDDLTTPVPAWRRPAPCALACLGPAGETMVRQEEHRSHPDARILVDTRQSGYPDAVPDVGESWSPAAHSEAFEWVVRMTASLGVHLEACGFRVGIEETAPPQIEPLGERWEGGRRVEAFLTSLAAVRLIDRPHDEVGIGTTSDPEGPVFALLSDPDEATISWLLKRRRAGQVAVAFVLDARAALRERLTEAGCRWSRSTSVDRAGRGVAGCRPSQRGARMSVIDAQAAITQPAVRGRRERRIPPPTHWRRLLLALAGVLAAY